MSDCSYVCPILSVCLFVYLIVCFVYLSVFVFVCSLPVLLFVCNNFILIFSYIDDILRLYF